MGRRQSTLFGWHSKDTPDAGRTRLRTGLLVILLVGVVSSGRPGPGAAQAPGSSNAASKAKGAALLQAGSAALEAGDSATAVSLLEKAVEAAPEDPAVREELAKAVRARAQSHGKADALTAAGQAALDAGGFDKAIGYFEKALEDWRDSPTARAGLAETLRRQRESTKSRALQLAMTFKERGQWDTARDEYLNALKADPDDQVVQAQLAAHIARRPWAPARAWLKAWSDAMNEAMPWLLGAFVVAIVVAANVINWCRSRRSIDVLPFDGPDDAFRKGTGAAMAAIASSQLHDAGLGLEPGVVGEPLTTLGGKLTDAQAKLLTDVIAWLFPQRGYRLQATVFQLPGVTETLVTAKLISFGFWAPRERVIKTATLGHGLTAPVHETLARLTAAWAEWHVARP
jgi:Tfp pilus assembly protein PilF